MRKATLCGFALAMFLVTGCGDSPEKLMKDQLSIINETCDVLETIKDKDTAEKAKPKLEAIAKKSKDIEERSKKLKMDEMTKEKKEELQNKYKEDAGKAMGRMMGVMMKIGGDKDIQAVLKDVDMKGLMGGGK